MIWIYICSMFVYPISALAYLDPGTGSLLVQFFVAAFAGVAVTVRMYWHSVKNFIARLIRKNDSPAQSKDDET